MLNICSSVHDRNQSTIHKDSNWTSQRAKEFYLKLRASGRNASEDMRLKKCGWRNESEDRAPEDTSLEARSSEAMVIRSYFTRVDKVQCTKCTTTNSAHASATCLYIKTRITVILLQTLFRFKWNRFEISSSYDNYQIRQKINGEESKLQARQVDVTASSQRLSNPLYI